MSQNTLVFDLDDTICFPNLDKADSNSRYMNARPNYLMIDSLRLAKNKGFRIVIYTARRMLTHNGDIEKIKEDVMTLTMEWLRLYSVPYDDLIFGKPYGVYYIDDKAMRPDEFMGFMKNVEYCFCEDWKVNKV